MLLISALLVINSVLAQQVDQNPALQAEIKKLDLAHAMAIYKGDALALDSLMDDDVTVNHPINQIVKEKKELLDLIKQGVIRYTSFERSPEAFLFFNDMVVVMGNEIVVPAQGAPNAEKRIQRRYTNIWIKKMPVGG
ncbi:nuclear transport factor 2 family protein [Pontibacter korlensis]